MTSQTYGFGFDFDTFTKGVRIASSYTTSLFTDNQMIMSPTRPDGACGINAENFAYISFDSATFGGP